MWIGSEAFQLVCCVQPAFHFQSRINEAHSS
jgi:hypothetical protein